MLALGIDTGGTCTDAVIYDMTAKKVLASTKTNTTHEDLTVCILQVMKNLPENLLYQTDFIALSTTLATNACVEGKGGRAKLVFIGMDPKDVAVHAPEYGLPGMDEIYCLPAEIPLEISDIVEPDWETFRKDLHKQFTNCDSIAITQLNAKVNNGALEKHAKKIITEELNLPCITGYELFQEFNIYRRGASALLNARLIPVIQDFLHAIRSSLDQMQLERPIVIVRSDGTMMNESYACERPIETLLCGPAASIMGAMELCNSPNQVIVDMGGTTSDVALVKEGTPVRVTNGIQIGTWKTFVHGMFVDTFGLGGDSTIIRDINGELGLDTVRSIPLCMLAAQYPSVTQKLQELNSQGIIHSRNLFEFYVLLKDISDSPLYDTREKQICSALKSGPLLVRETAAAVREDIYSFDVKRLESEGIVRKAALTPTDIMHIRGDFEGYDGQASKEAVTFLARCLKISQEDICAKVYDLVKKKLFLNVLRILMKDCHPEQKETLMNQLDFLYESAYAHAVGKTESFFAPAFAVNAVLVGIGAPIHVFLPPVAEMLGVPCLIPEFAPVANALGAVVGNISSEVTIEIKQTTTIGNADQYYFTGRPECGFFDSMEEAIQAARQTAQKEAEQKALRQGAGKDLAVTFRDEEHGAMTNFGKMFLSHDVTATVIGTMDL